MCYLTQMSVYLRKCPYMYGNLRIFTRSLHIQVQILIQIQILIHISYHILYNVSHSYLIQANVCRFAQDLIQISFKKSLQRTCIVSFISHSKSNSLISNSHSYLMSHVKFSTMYLIHISFKFSFKQMSVFYLRKI